MSATHLLYVFRPSLFGLIQRGEFHVYVVVAEGCEEVCETT